MSWSSYGLKLQSMQEEKICEGLVLGDCPNAHEKMQYFINSKGKIKINLDTALTSC